MKSKVFLKDFSIFRSISITSKKTFQEHLRMASFVVCFIFSLINQFWLYQFHLNLWKLQEPWTCLFHILEAFFENFDKLT